MKYLILNDSDASENRFRIRFRDGFSLLEMLICVCILIPLMAGAMQFFTVGVNQHASERSSIEATQDASAGFDLMTTEIAQAGARRYAATKTASVITPYVSMAQTIPVDSSNGFWVGDTVEVDSEQVLLTAVGNNTITGVFEQYHADKSTVRLDSLPYKDGVLRAAGLNPNTATTVTTLAFFGDIYGDGNMYFVVYDYDAVNGQITRSMTNLNGIGKQPALPLITNIKPGSVQFTLHTDDLNVITSVTVSLTVENEWETGPKKEEINLSANVRIQSAEAASELYLENMQYGPVNNLPSVPSSVISFNGGYIP